jgi:hypothetical protein
MLLRCKKCNIKASRALRLYRQQMGVSQKEFDLEYSRRMQLSKNQDAATLLVGNMRDLSEAMWCAGWCSGLEFSLWRDVLDGGIEHQTNAEVFASRLSKPEAVKLRGLARRAGGWWMWWKDPKGCSGVQATGEVFVPMREWKKIYAENEKKQARETS